MAVRPIVASRLQLPIDGLDAMGRIGKPVLIVIAALFGTAAPDLSRAGPLHDAARSGDVGRAVELISGGADVEALDDAVLTPLVVAALHGKTEMVQLLLDRGARPDTRDGNGFSALHAAAHGGHCDVVLILLELDVDVNDQNNRASITPLHAAAERNFVLIAEKLLDNGADQTLRSATKHTPLSMAVLNGHEEMTALLRDRGASCDKIKLERYRDFCRSSKR